MNRLALIALTLLSVFTTGVAQGKEKQPEWIGKIAAITIQDRGRTMPLDTYAKQIAVELTGRSHWKEGRGPEAFAGRDRIQLLCDLLFRPDELADKPLITIENRPFKTRIGLDSKKRFFTPMELAQCRGLREMIDAYSGRKTTDPNTRPTKFEKLALNLNNSLGLISFFMEGRPLQIVPTDSGPDLLGVGMSQAAPGTEKVQQALHQLREAYLKGEGIDAAVDKLIETLHQSGTISPKTLRRAHLEVFYNHHRPFMMTAVFFLMAIIAVGFSYITLRKVFLTLGVLLTLAGLGEQIFGLYLRTTILGRAPVSNTYEALLWMGIVAIAIAALAQLINRKAWYLLAGLIAAELSVLFSMMVPLQDQTNALPPVLRNNYWLTVHVLTIVASYGVLGLSAVLGHVYLFKAVIFGKPEDVRMPVGHPLITQVYRSMQIGLILLTAGTILGGVWAADSWGRFWGWDPKETWALISIIVYFILLHARHIGWLRDFGLGIMSIMAFLCIIWTFYGVNYVMASGLHSYGFGNGGELWVAIWAIAELVFIALCKLRYNNLRKKAGKEPEKNIPAGKTREAGTVKPAT